MLKTILPELKEARLKSCPRCGGFIYVDWEGYQWVQKCLMCSRVYHISPTKTQQGIVQPYPSGGLIYR